MTAPDPRVFARWRREPDPGPGFAQIPEDGACLSAFLLVPAPHDPRKVLLGQVDPSADWGRMAALEGDRLAKAAGRWMLPSSHLMEYEGPSAAARRIADEQLGIRDLAVPEPHVVSDSYGRPGAPGSHWDLDFLFRAAWPEGVPVAGSAWKRLEFVDPGPVPRSAFARSHDDILRFAGFLPAD
jgi:ADP-ribose pyrophosphatase YjhB (NUDIX family)